MTELLLLIAALLAAPIAQAGKFPDFNNDGKSGIFWRNIATAENYLFPMNGTTILPTEGSTRTVPPTDWRAKYWISTFRFAHDRRRPLGSRPVEQPLECLAGDAVR